MRGFSLVELMVAMTLSLLLMGGVIQVFLGSKQTYLVNEALSRMQENARFALDRINEDLSASGYMGCNDSRGTDLSGNLLLVNALTNQTAEAYNFAFPLTGTDNVGPNNSDRISIRRAVTSSGVPLAAPMTSPTATLLLDDTHPNYASLQQYQTLAVSDCNSTSIFMITNDPTTSSGVIRHDPNITSPAGSPNAGQSNLVTTIGGTDFNDLKARYGAVTASEARTFRVATTTYDIQTGESGRPALFMNGVELIEDVTDLQVEFGLDADGTPGVERYVASNDAALTAAGMNAVASVRLALTFNVDETINGQAVTKTFTQTYRLRNR